MQNPPCLLCCFPSDFKNPEPKKVYGDIIKAIKFEHNCCEGVFSLTHSGTAKKPQTKNILKKSSRNYDSKNKNIKIKQVVSENPVTNFPTPTNHNFCPKSLFVSKIFLLEKYRLGLFFLETLAKTGQQCLRSGGIGGDMLKPKSFSSKSNHGNWPYLESELGHNEQGCRPRCKFSTTFFGNTFNENEFQAGTSTL